MEAQLRHTSKAAAEEFCLGLDLGLDAASGVSTAAGFELPSALPDDTAPSASLGHLKGSGRSYAPQSNA